MLKRLFTVVALVGATTLMTADAEAGIFGRRCGVVRTCQTVNTCQPTYQTTCQPAQVTYQPLRVTYYRTDSCGNYRVAPVRTIIHRVLPPYRTAVVTPSNCTSGSCSIDGGPVQKSYPAPVQVEVESVTPPAPNVLPKAPVEEP